MDERKRQLMWYGMILFLLGLFTGLAETQFTNVRMGLAAHLEGVMNGTFLVAFGAAWSEIRLTARLKSVAYWAVLYGTYANWLVTMLAAVFGTGALSPISAPGLKAAAWQESLIHGGFLSVALAIIAASVLAIWGLRPGAPAESRQESRQTSL
jgi:hydroxylaminobenzene mutase